MRDEVASIDKRIERLNQEMANLIRAHEDQVKRLAEVPGLGVDSASRSLPKWVPPQRPSYREASLLLGRRMPWRGRERGTEPQPPVAAGQPSHAADSESSCQCSGQTQGKHLRNALSALCAASGTQPNYLNNCPQALSFGLEDLAPGDPLRGARPRGQQAKAHPKNDPSTSQAWLSYRTDPFSISHHGMIAISAARFSTLRPLL